MTIKANDFSMDATELRKYSIMISTPMYGGVCNGLYTNSMINLVALCMKLGIGLRTSFSFNESLITRARNYHADEFLRSDCTHMMFIDADIGFDAEDVIRLLAFQVSRPEEYSIIGAVYPKKVLAVEKMHHMARISNNPKDMLKVQADFVFNFADDKEHKTDEITEALEIGTGFMMIPRETFDMYNQTFPEYKYLPDHARTEHFSGDREITMFFQADVDPNTRRYLSEDYWFCQKIRECGGRVWFCPWMSDRLEHVGSHIYKGSLQAIAEAGLSPTINKKDI